MENGFICSDDDDSNSENESNSENDQVENHYPCLDKVVNYFNKFYGKCNDVDYITGL